MNLQEALHALDLAVKELAKAAISDDKTPLGNAMGLAEAASLVGTAEGNPDVVIFGDLNRFKGINDRLGHAAGDVAISAVGETIYELLVQGCEAQAFRRSGDEFVILLSANRLAEFESKTKMFAPCAFTFEGVIHSTGMSFGYAVSGGETDFSDLLARAETACRTAKAQGDGACVQWTEKVEREALVHFRDRCSLCGAQITVNVPKETAPSHNKIVSCPCCEKSLVSQ